jgi:outer membrane protein OmpA-like peptidoglycan-associated protein
MYLKQTLATAVVITFTSFFTSPARGQNPPGHPETVPIYRVTVIGSTITAVSYQYRNGPTQIDFHGTVLLPQAKGDATIESKAGRTEIDAHFEHLVASQQFGAEYLTYVLWAVTPEGHVKNLGEVLANGSDKAHTHVTTDLQAFGLLITAEPYSAVRLPSDVVVLENKVRPGTLGSTEPIQAHYEFMPRGTYHYTVPTAPPAEGPRVSMAEYEGILEVYQAQNAVQIAESQGAGKYASDVMDKARRQYENARQLQAGHAGRTAVVTAAREAAQTAEDARSLALVRSHDAELADARSETEHERQLRVKAEADAQRAQSDAAQARVQYPAAGNALESERSSSREADAPALSNPPASFNTPPAVEAERPMAIRNEPDRSRTALRARLLAQLSGSLEPLDTSRGLVVTVRDFNFRETALTPSAAADLARVAATVMSQPGLMVEVSGNSDAAGAAAERFSSDRAAAVKDALIHAGLPASRITAQGLGNRHPFGSNATAQGREANRRVEVVIHGDPIGNSPSWDKTYSLSLGR